MKNFVKSGDVIAVTAGADVASGAGHLVGAIFGIAQADALSGAAVELVTRGVFTHTKTSAQAWAQGAKIYWDDTAKVFTTASSGNTLVGAAAAAAVNPSSTGTVKIDGAIR